MTGYLADLLTRSDRAVAVITDVLEARTPDQFYAAKTGLLAFADQEAAYLSDPRRRT